MFKVKSEKGLRQHLLCIFYKPANVIPCNHNFCLACISKWRMQDASSDSCPECRAVIRSMGKDALINAFVSMFLDYFPEKSRDAEDIRLMNKIECDYASLSTAVPRENSALLNPLYLVGTCSSSEWAMWKKAMNLKCEMGSSLVNC
ncbi:zinc finger, C3HC4 type [Cooperia oncophora]